jgi:hypothetical protein
MGKWAGRSMTEALRLGQVEDEELRAALSSVFPRQAQFRAGEVEYRTSADETALVLRTKAGCAVDAVTGPAITDDLEQRLRDAVEKGLAKGTQTLVFRWIMFSGRPVNGQHRHGDVIQIGPAPEAAPRPDTIMGQHPFIAEFRVASSPVLEVQDLRVSRRGREVELLLNLLLYHGVEMADRQRGNRWVWARETPPSDTIYRSLGYFIPEFEFRGNEFSTIDSTQALAFIDDESYFARKWQGDELALPASFGHLLNLYDTLPTPESQRLLRACYWLQTARLTWDISKSLYLVSLVQAIEAMASGVAQPDSASADGPTKLFMEFMKTHAPGKPSNSTLDIIYQTRSKLTHGSRLLQYDEPSAFGLNENYARDSDAASNAQTLCRGAIVNWLASQDPARATPLLTAGRPRSKPLKPGTKSGVIVIARE